MRLMFIQKKSINSFTILFHLVGVLTIFDVWDFRFCCNCTIELGFDLSNDSEPFHVHFILTGKILEACHSYRVIERCHSLCVYGR